jgi:hypothetical protein
MLQISAVKTNYQGLPPFWRYLQLIKAFRSLKIFVISLFFGQQRPKKGHHDLTEILSKFILDIWMVSKLSRVNPSPWICPFNFLKAAFFGSMV